MYGHLYPYGYQIKVTGVLLEMATETASHTPDPDIIETLWKQAEELRPRMVDFARRLIQTPSLPGQEGNVAELVRSEMLALGYDAIVDQAGNVVGRLEANKEPTEDRPRRS